MDQLQYSMCWQNMQEQRNIAYFVPGWENARGCKIEHQCAVEYGIDRIE